MKRIITFIILLTAVVSAKAQFGGGSTITGKISGTLLDSVTKQPVGYASVTIFHSVGTAVINGMLTDEKGKFAIYNIKPGNYRISITYVGGYKAKTINPVVTTPSKPDNNVGTIVLVPDNKQLAEVNVTGAKALIENHIDKIVYNAEKDLTSAGGNASDVLQKVPLVSMDINGNVAIRGDQNVKVLINGRPSGITSTSLSDALKSMPADQIKSIEVITSPSAKYDAEGSAGIINIITKSSKISGFSGAVSGGFGTKQNNGNILLSYNKNRFSFTANLSGNLTWPQTTPTDFFQALSKGDTVSTTKYHATSKVKRHAIMGTLNANYQFNEYNTLSSDLRLNGGGFHIKGQQNDVVTDNQIASANATYTGSTMSDNTLSGFDWDIDYDHKFKKADEDLDFSAQWSHSIINTSYLYNYTDVNPNQRGFNNGANNEYTLQGDYVVPVSKVVKIEAGGKSIFRRLSSDYKNYNDTTAGRTLQPADYIYDGINSNYYTYNQNVYAGYTVFTFTLPKSFAILAGARFEDTEIDGTPNNPDQTEITPFHSSYQVFIPSLTLQKALNTSSTLKLSYSKRITRPSLQFLNPFLNTSSIQSETQGNPALSPEVSQTIELNLNSFIKSSLINVSVYYKHTSDHIEGIAKPFEYISGSDTIPATLTTYQNIGHLNSWGSSFFGSIQPVKMLTIRASINAYTFHPNASLGYLDQGSTNSTYIQYNAFASGQLTFKHDIIAEAFGVTNSAQHTIQGTNPGFYYYAFGLRKQFDNKKASLGLNVVNPFSYYEDFNQNIKSPTLIQTRVTQFPFQSFGITFSYKFGKTTFSNPDDPTAKKKGVNNDDLKQGGGDMGGGGGGPSR